MLQEKRSFLDSDGNWLHQDDGAAIVRLDSRITESGKVQNIFYRRQQDEWQLAEESSLSAVEQGLVWEAWKTNIDGEPYLACRGIRALDDKLGRLFSNLKVRSLSGQAFDHLADAGYQFVLDVSDAKEFHRRLSEAGGRIVQSGPIAHEIQEQLQAAEEALRRIEQIIHQESQITSETERGDLSRVSQVTADDEQIKTMIEIIENKTGLALASIDSLQDRDAQQLRNKAREIIDGGRMLVETRQLMLDQINDQAGYVEEIGSPGKTLLAREVGRMARQQGLEVVTTENGVKIHLGDRWLVLGDKIELSSE